MTKYKIKEAYFFVSEDDKGEGLAATCQNLGEGQHMFMPLVACDKDRYNSLLPFAKLLVKEGKKIKVIKLSNREDLGEITEE